MQIKGVTRLPSPQYACTHTYARRAEFIKAVIHQDHRCPPVSPRVTQCWLDKQGSHHTAEETPSKKFRFLSTLHLSVSDRTGSRVKLSYEAFQSATTSNKQVHCTNGILYNLEGFQRERGFNMATVQRCLRILPLFSHHVGGSSNPAPSM